MNGLNRIIIFFVLTLFSTFCYAESFPQSYSADPHIQVATYDPNQVYIINGLQGYTTAIEFSPDEKIISVNIGDSSAWLVNVQAYLINLKPIADNPETNMNVVTSRGTYQFFLTAPPEHRDATGHLIRRPTSRTIFLLRFRYPEIQPASIHPNNPVCPRVCNSCYSARGDQCIAPYCVYDDGRFTYFNFGCRKKIPAIFLVDCNGNESLVNYHIRGEYVVVETTGCQFTLRSGCHVASVFNEAAS